MKGPQVSVLVWLGNLVLLCGAGLAGYQVYAQSQGERADVNRQTGEAKPKIKKEDWTRGASAKDAAQQQDFHNDKLSLRVRPKPVVEVKPEIKPEVKPEPEPDDATLKAEVAKWLDSKFAVLRTLSGNRDMAGAWVIAKDAGNAVFKVYAREQFAHFRDNFKDADDKLAEKLKVMDVAVVDIKRDGVVFKAPSVRPKYASKYFEVELPVQDDPNFKATESGGKLGKAAGSTGVGKVPDRIKMPDSPLPNPGTPEVDTRPKESTYDAKTDTWTIGLDDYANINTDDLAKYAKVVSDKNGKILGIQITEDIPENNVVLARGGKKGDIIKSINGKPVTDMSSIRGIVGAERKNGVEKFVVEFERDGVAGTKTFNVPLKKTR